MRQLNSSKPLLRVADKTVTLGGVDLTDVLYQLQIEISADGVYATLTAAVEVEIEGVGVDRVGQVGDPLDGVTVEELDGVLASRGFSESAGAAILAHLRTRPPGPRS